MTQTDGARTKAKILKVAEQLFAEHGFSGTSVDSIARAAAVNKALIYYHFQDKQDLVTSLFRSIVDEVAEHVAHVGPSKAGVQARTDERDAIKDEIRFLARKKKVLTVLMMESLKSADAEDALLHCAEMVIRSEHEVESGASAGEWQRIFVHEFFTGFLPLVSFVIFQDKLRKRLGCDKDVLLEYFVDSFQRSHLASHNSDSSEPRGASHV